MTGYYTFLAAKDNLKIKFFGETVPTAKGILGRDVIMPLKDDEIPIITEEILQKLDKLKELGYSMEEFVYR